MPMDLTRRGAAPSAAISAVAVIGAAIGMVWVAAGCAAGPQTAAVAATPAPWVLKGSGAFQDSGTRAFYGVGSVAGVRNRPLAQAAAANRARSEVAKVFETYSASLMKDYMTSISTGKNGSTSAATQGQLIEQSVKTFSSATLSGVQITDYWTDPNDGTMYALARLDLEKFHGSLDKIADLPAPAKEHLRKNADRAFDDLAKEAAQRRP